MCAEWEAEHTFDDDGATDAAAVMRIDWMASSADSRALHVDPVAAYLVTTDQKDRKFSSTDSSMYRFHV